MNKQKKVRVVHCITTLEIGGAQRVMYDVIAGLDRSHFDPLVITFCDGPYRLKFQELGIPVHTVTGLLPDKIINFFALIKKLQPSLIHTNLWLANLLGGFAGAWYAIPTVSVLHNQPSLNGKLRMLIDRLTLPLRKQQFVAVSVQVATNFEKAYHLTEKKIAVIGNGIIPAVSLHHSMIDDLRMQQEWDASCFIFGAVGRFDPVKNYPDLLASFAQVALHCSHARLLILGAGSMPASLRKQIDELALHDKIMVLCNQQAECYYPLFDCFVQPSWQEGVSIALLEAMSYACPVIVTGQDGKHPVVTDKKNGVIIKPGKKDDLASAMIELTCNKNMREQMGQAAKKTIDEEYRLDQMQQSYKNLFARMLER